ncbi:Chaperonin GroEL [Dirofilaria immitis]
MEFAVIDKPGSTLTELIFIHKKFFKLSAQENSILNLSANFYTNYGPRSVRWSICFSSYTTLAVNSHDSYAIPPRGKYKISVKAISKQNLEISTELMFERSLVDVWNSEFLTKILKILESSEFYDCTLKLSYELRFEAHEFIQISPWLFSTAFVTPDIPANLSNDDYRCVIDFIIHTKDGTIETVRYLVYLTIDRIHNEIDANPNMKSIIIEHRRESVQQMINYALKGSFDLIDASPDVLDDFILCIRAFRPRGFWTLIHHITDGLRKKLNDEWEKLDIDIVLRYLNLSVHHRLHELCSKAIILIANVHYKQFMLEYNVDSSGSKLEIYNTLKDSELPFEGNAIQKIQAVYYAGKQTEVLFRYRIEQGKENTVNNYEYMLWKNQ